MSDSKPDYGKLSLEAHEAACGKISIEPKMPLETTHDLSLAYTPGVAEPCRAIAANTDDVYKYTSKGNMVAVVSDGSAVLGLGNIGAEASLPVMEGKCVLFKKFAGIDAVPIIIRSQDPDVIVETVKQIHPTFGGINLEDIKAPQCFDIEERLVAACDIPIMHDDQHGTATVTLAGMYNALKVIGKEFSEIRVVVSGAGAAGVAITKLLVHAGLKDVIMADSRGAIYAGRENLNPVKEEIAKITNLGKKAGSLADILDGADVFIGVSGPGILTGEMVKRMNECPVIFAMANPTPEIMPDEAKAAGARIVATGRSDFPNQINNVPAFPGIFRGALDAGVKKFNRSMFVAAAKAIADSVAQPTEELIIPGPFEPGVANRVAKAVADASRGKDN